jgi:dTMP kinase
VLITLEGVEGSGKSTHLRLLSAWLTEIGLPHSVTREPGGTELGAAIRGLLLNPREEAVDPLCELLLYVADRRQHVARVLAPRLAAGDLVLCDRFADATLAYQGWGRGLDLEMVRHLNELACAGLKPDLTLLLDCEPEEGLARARHRAEGLGPGESREDRFEQEELEFHRRVRRGYRALAKQEPGRIRVIESRGPAAGVQERLRSVVAQALGIGG